jgi:hypothetical protein
MMAVIDAVALLLGYWVLTAVALLAMLGLARAAARAVAGRRARRQAVRAAVDAILVLADPRIHARAVGDVAWQIDGAYAQVVPTPRGRTS